MKTSTIKTTAPTWFVVDATDMSLGRIAAKVAFVLRGKHKPTYSPHQLCGDHVVILNIEKLKIDPMVGMKKLYRKHTGYLGHMKVRTLNQMMEEKPTRAMEIAIKGMLPTNRLRTQMLKRLHVFVGTEHPYAPQKPVSLDLFKI